MKDRFARNGHKSVKVVTAIASVLFGAYFVSLATYNPAADNYRFPWKAHWIASPFKSVNACFRKEFILTHTVPSAYIAVAGNNFFRLKLNGASVRPFFTQSKYATWMAEQSVYTGIGYPRHGDRGIIYEVSSKLRIGKNVLTAEVQSDDGSPSICVQGETFGNQPTKIATDGSWKVSPVSDSAQGESWEDPYFEDSRWKSALDLGFTKDVWVNGDVACLRTPPSGSFVHAPDPRVQHHLVKRLEFSSGRQDGWLRAEIGQPYDLRINGRVLYSTSMLDRYETLPWSKRGNTDAFTRVASGSDSGQYPSPFQSRRIDLFVLKNAFKAGSNNFEIVLHPQPIPEMRAPPTLWIDGEVTDDGKRIPIHTDSTWSAQTELGRAGVPPVLESPATFSTLVYGSLHFTKVIDSGIYFPLRVAIWAALGFLLCLVSLAARSLLPGLRKASAGYSLVPLATILSTCYGLQVIFENSSQHAYFDSSQFATAVLLIGCGTQILASFVFTLDKVRARPKDTAAGHLPRKLLTSLSPILISIVLFSAAFLYFHGIENNSLLADEYVSVLASTGIRHHGLPIYDRTGITYTRSSLYSYLLALTLLISSKGTYLFPRLLSSAFQIGSVFLSYTWAKKIKGEIAGILAAILVAFSPMGVFFAREIRFYAQFEFFLTLTGYLCWLSIQNPNNARYRVGTMLAYSCAYLSQQFALVILPAVFISACYPGNLKSWLRGSSLFAVLFAIFVMGADGFLFFKYCLTQFPYIDDESVSLFAVHNDILEVLPSTLFSGYERTGIVEGFVFLLGGVGLFISWLIRPVKRGYGPKKLRPMPYLYLVCVSSILLTALLASRPTTRYIIHMLPMVSIVVACVLVQLGVLIASHLRYQVGNRTSIVSTAVYTVCIFALVVAAYRPVRTWNATGRSSNRDITGAMRFLRTHASSKDLVVILNPESAMVELEKCDYLWRPKRGSIFKYVGQDGSVRERNSGATVIDDLPKLRSLMAQGKRVWIVAQNSNLDNTGSNTSGELASYININYNYVDQPLGLAIMMWDPVDGHLRSNATSFGENSNGLSDEPPIDVGDAVPTL